MLEKFRIGDYVIVNQDKNLVYQIKGFSAEKMTFELKSPDFPDLLFPVPNSVSYWEPQAGDDVEVDVEEDDATYCGTAVGSVENDMIEVKITQPETKAQQPPKKH